MAFSEGEEARKAIEALNEHQFDGGDRLFIDYVQPKDQRRKMLVQKHLKYKNETNLYIRSIRPEVTEDQLRSAFAKYGTITSICLKKQVLNHKVGESKELKFGFVNLGTSEETKQAFQNGKKDADIIALIDPTEKPDFLFYAQPATVRKQYLRMQTKNFKSTQMLQTNLQMLKQFYQTMMGGSMGGFRPNNRGGNFQRNNAGGQGRPQNFNNKFQNKGPRQGREGGNFPGANMGQMNQMNPMNMMMNPMVRISNFSNLEFLRPV